jgi:hypothetical protein
MRVGCEAAIVAVSGFCQAGIVQGGMVVEHREHTGSVV